MLLLIYNHADVVIKKNEKIQTNFLNFWSKKSNSILFSVRRLLSRVVYSVNDEEKTKLRPCVGV